MQCEGLLDFNSLGEEDTFVILPKLYRVFMLQHESQRISCSGTSCHDVHVRLHVLI